MRIKLHNQMELEFYERDGSVKDTEVIRNAVTTEGLNDILSKYFKAGNATPTFFFGLIDNAGFTEVSAADTLSSHAGWSENTAYDSATRPSWDEGPPAGGSISSDSEVTIVMSTAQTIRGVIVATDSQKGGTSGVLWCTALFALERSFAAGESWTIKNYTVNATG